MVSVGILIDLRLRPEAGGHVKCWERLAEGAIGLADQLDLTLHFLGDQEQKITMAENVRYLLHRPRFGTDRLPFLKDVADQTDLANFNPKLYPYLEQHDVLHATHQLFTFGKTALKFAQENHKPLVASIHTDVPKYTEIYTRQVLQKFVCQGSLYQLLAETFKIPQQRRQAMEQQLQDYWHDSQHVWASQPEDYDQVAQIISPQRVSLLPRGIDKAWFHPNKSDRQQLQQTYGIPTDVPLLLFVGRLNSCKNVMVIAEAISNLLTQGIPVHSLFVGQGPSQPAIQNLLGSAATFTGWLPYSELASIYASCDLFVFPSETETYGNVVVEAKACGLPVVVSSQGGAAQLVQREGEDGIHMQGNNPQEWAKAIAHLLRDASKLKTMGQAARYHIETTWPSWQEVLMQDLLPVWQAVASGASQRR
ncbi:MAG: glycosyltransferase family 1 protein [Symploca sp. SIO2E6]|nr:glycosyltransferase family 1 protein [Symploca sp. SIO2E6]